MYTVYIPIISYPHWWFLSTTNQATVVALDQLLVSNGWQGCALSARDSGDLAAEVEMEELRKRTGVPVSWLKPQMRAPQCHG